MAITDYTLDLKDAMDSHYGAGSWSYRGGTAGSGTDIGPALNAMITTIRGLQRKRGKISIGPGDWELSTSGIDFSGIKLEGCGSQATIIWLNFSSSTGFAFSGNDGSGNSVDGGGMKGIGIKLETNQGSSTLYAIYLKGNSTLQPDQMLFEDLYLTGGDVSYFYEGFHVDGTSRTSPQGVRIGSLHNIQIFNCQNLAAYFSNVVGWDIVNLGAYSPKSGTNGADVWVYGGGSSSTNSIDVSLVRTNIGGTLHIANASVVYAEGAWGTLSNTGTTTITEAA